MRTKTNGGLGLDNIKALTFEVSRIGGSSQLYQGAGQGLSSRVRSLHAEAGLIHRLTHGPILKPPD